MYTARLPFVARSYPKLFANNGERHRVGRLINRVTSFSQLQTSVEPGCFLI